MVENELTVEDIVDALIKGGCLPDEEEKSFYLIRLKWELGVDREDKIIKES